MGSRGRNRRAQPGGWRDAAMIWFLLAGAGVTVAFCYGAVHLGHRFAGIDDTPGDPWQVLFGVLSGEVRWPRASSVVLAVEVAVVAAAGCYLWWRVVRRRGKGTRVDWTASQLGHGREIAGIGAKSAKATAQRLGVRSRLPGVPIGKTLMGGHPLYGSWEDMHILIAGPRVGKSVCFAVPAILDAPGAALVTSNKRDLVDATRDPREKSAGPVWVFDPQGIAEEPPTWWWDPLTYVTDEVKAANLAQHFMTGSREADAKTDAFFDPAGRDLLAGLLLAAACDRRPITEVYRWLTRPTDDTPVHILSNAGYPLIADQVAGVVTAPEKQRGGVYGTAAQMASCLTSSRVLQWVTRSGSRPHFDPTEFVRSGGTLYSLSKEGRGTAGPLVTALTVAVVEAAEEIATGMPGGRLELPMVGVLDEAANVCKWKDLPDLYSHYGSRGIVLQTILQSWSQGEEVWGKGGMNKLWSASNVAIYGGGVKEEEFLERLAKLVGQYDRVSRSVSTQGSKGGLFSSGVSTSRQLNRERILDVDDLAALPKGRAVVLSSGNRPTLIETVPWMAGPHASEVRSSITAHDPLANRVVRDAGSGLEGIEQQLSTGATIHN